MICKFDDCSHLTSVTIGNSVTSIGEKAFGSCSSLKVANMGSKLAAVGTQTFYGKVLCILKLLVFLQP